MSGGYYMQVTKKTEPTEHATHTVRYTVPGLGFAVSIDIDSETAELLRVSRECGKMDKAEEIRYALGVIK